MLNKYPYADLILTCKYEESNAFLVTVLITTFSSRNRVKCGNCRLCFTSQRKEEILGTFAVFSTSGWLCRRNNGMVYLLMEFAFHIDDERRTS
jgi:hypothetical protein